MSEIFNAYDLLRSSGQKLTGVVESIGYGEKDPQKQDGRVLVRLSVQSETGITTQMLSWVKVAQLAQDGAMRGLGKTPGHRLTPGQMVELDFNSQQILQVTHVIQDDAQEEETSGKHPYKSKKEEHVSPLATDFEQEFSQFNSSPVKTTPEQSKKVHVPNGLKAQKVKDDPVKKSTKEAPEPKRYGNKKGVKSQTEKTPQNLGGFPRQRGSFLNATKNTKELLGRKGEIIPNELDMILSLQQKAKGGGLHNNFSLVAGAQNVMQALQGIMQLVNNVKGKEKKKDDEDEQSLEEYLRALYKEQTGKEPLDENGNETEEYQAWKTEMLLQINKDYYGV